MFSACGHGYALTVSEGTPHRSPPLIAFHKPALRSLTPRHGCHTLANSVDFERQQARLARPIVSLQLREMASEAAMVHPLIKNVRDNECRRRSRRRYSGGGLRGHDSLAESKRSVSVRLAREIATAARENGAEPVGVFVDESATEIERACSDANLGIAQIRLLPGSCCTAMAQELLFCKAYRSP